jgi:hypothetical protein
MKKRKQHDHNKARNLTIDNPLPCDGSIVHSSCTASSWKRKGVSNSMLPEYLHDLLLVIMVANQCKMLYNMFGGGNGFR